MKQELIWELMKQAGELAYEEHTAKCLKDGLNPSMPYGNNLGKTFEKFAELIVRECADIALEQKKRVEEQETFNQYDYDWNRARIQQSQHIADKVKQHFGVEE